MIEENSQVFQQQKQSAEQNSQRKIQRQLPFFKNPTISFVKVGHCHMCKSRSKIVYQCHKNFQSTSCEKKFCLDCLVLIYKENIIENIQKVDSWRCPYIRKVCRCKNCCTSRKQQFSILQIDSNLSVYANLRQRIKPITEQDDDSPELDESTKCLLKQKFRKVLQMNGQLITKVNTHYHKLTQEQIQFYNKLIFSNLKVLNQMSTNMIENQTIIEE